MIAAQDAPIIPYWQNSMLVVGRSNIHNMQKTIDLDVPHAVLAAVEVLAACEERGAFGRPLFL